MKLFKHVKNLLIILFSLAPIGASSGITSLIDNLSNKVENVLADNGIKPYVIPLDQGRLLEDAAFQRLDIGLSRKQVTYLLGKPSSSSPFMDNKWDYLYFNNTNRKEIKIVSVFFKNEKVFEITINNKPYKKLGSKKVNQEALTDAPINKLSNDKIKNTKLSSIVISLDDNKGVDTKLGLCTLNDFEIFDDVKILSNADESTLEIRADNQSQSNTQFIAKGNAEAEREKDMLKAETINYDTNSKNVKAAGNVKYFNKDITVYSEKANYTSNSNDVNFSKAKYYMVERDGSGRADEIFLKNNKDVILKNGSYTSCNLNDPDWELTSTTTSLFEKSERGESYNMLLKYKNVPIFYTPFISYPLSDKRQSGILTPSFGTAGDSGTSLSVPYYFNLAKNYDATVQVTSLSDRGILFDNEFRYLGLQTSSLLNFTHLDNDDEFGRDRYLYSLNDKRKLYENITQSYSGYLGSTISSEVSYSRVSDLDYFDDFGNSLSTTSQSNVKREIRIIGEKFTGNGLINYELSSLSYQPTQTGVTDQYETAPSFKLNYNSLFRDGFNYNLKSSIDKFSHKDNTQTEGTRYLLYPSIEMPIQTEGWELTPKLGLRYIDYSLENNASGEESKTTPIASLRGKLYFEKNVGNKLYTLEPEAYLLYIPVGNQDSNPIFDSGLKEFKYSLFSENKFYGEDRVNDAKQMTLALTHRIIDDKSGDELFSGTLGQIIYFDDRDVHLTDDTKAHSDASNIIGLVNARINDYSTFALGSVFNPHAGHGMRNNVRYRYDASTGVRNKLFNADYRFIRGSEEEIDLSGVYSFNKAMSFVGKYNYSFSNNRNNAEDLIDTMFGIEYDSCCYALKIVARNYWTGTKKDNILYVEFLPKGLTTTNNKTSTLLRKGIPGYDDKVNYE